ncbi:V-type proton ATPase subunit e 2, partial [Blattella germanica]
TVVLSNTIIAKIPLVLPFVVPKGPNRGILHVFLMITAVTCWLFCLCRYMAQMNTLMGSKLSNKQFC